MKRGLWKSWAILLPIVSLLGACSGATDPGVDNQAQLIETQSADANQRIEDWGKFMGLSSDEARAELEQAKLLDMVEQKKDFNQATLQAYLDIALKRDSILADGVNILNTTNQNAFIQLGRLSPTRSGGIGSQTSAELDETAAQDQKQKLISELTSQATLVRGRLLQGVEILGLKLEPSSMRDLLAGEIFSSLVDEFAAPLVDQLFGVEIDTASLEQKRFAAEPLASVSFAVAGQVLSIYDFDGVAENPSSDLIEITIKGEKEFSNSFSITSARGTVRVLAARDNPYLVRLELVKEEPAKIVDSDSLDHLSPEGQVKVDETKDDAKDESSIKDTGVKKEAPGKETAKSEKN